MTEIKEIRISGFRGVRGILPLNFVKGNSIRSMVIYGRNGTGKSSITDSWEWFHSERIIHLSREGAGYNSYPHKNATSGETYIEIDFAKKELGTIRLTYDNKRITKPIVSGEMEKLRELAPHPCHIRFEDLTRFVFLTKTEKFDALALIMGFTPQVELQKAFRRVLREFEVKIEDKTKEVNRIKERLLIALDLKELDDNEYLDGMNKILLNNGVDKASLIADIDKKKDILNSLVVNDPRTARINLLKQVIESLNPSKFEKKFIKNLIEYPINVQMFLEDEYDLTKILLLDLYEQGRKIISQVDKDGTKVFSSITSSGQSVDVCPLCGQIYDGNLSDHISDETRSLNKLQELRNALEEKRATLQKQMPSDSDYDVSYTKLKNNLVELDSIFKLIVVKESALAVKEKLSTINKLLGCNAESLSFSILGEIKKSVELLQTEIKKFDLYRSQSEGRVREELNQLEKNNELRMKLVEGNKIFSFAFELWKELKTNERSLDNLKKISENFTEIVNKYIDLSMVNVQKRFEIISDDVKKYFGILEQDTDGLKGAVLKFLPEEDRAVELQIDFHGESIYPAYKYLSESQLNSFGLSVFLASAKYFNVDFKFIILDDIINSFDGYKRPRIIELLKTQFSEHQILLLTHDNVWHELLFESFPLSIKKRFARWEFNHGPIDSDGYAPLEKIKLQLDNDEPVEAGRNLGPYLERQFQDIGEKFEMLVKYNRKNEYTLDPLLNRFATRVKEKLGLSHPLYLASRNLAEDSGFRNLCAHWKNPDIQLTTKEMILVYDKWVEIENLARCQDEKCLSWVKYDSSTSTFVCPCRKTKLVKIN